MKQLFLAVFTVLFTAALFGGELKLLQEQTFKVSQGEKLFVEGEGGDIIIKSWDKDEVLVKIFGNSKAEKNIEFTIIQKEKEIFVSGKRKSKNIFNFFTSLSVKYEVMVPKKFYMELITSGGDIMVTDVDGNKLLKTSGGDIVIVKGAGELTASTSGGDIQVENTTGKVDVSTSGGDIIIKGNDMSIDAETSGGDIVVEYSGENKGINVGTSGGDITVLLEKTFKGDAELKTSGGDIEILLPSTSQGKLSSSKFVGKINDGGLPLVCKTSGGDITVKEFGK